MERFAQPFEIALVVEGMSRDADPAISLGHDHAVFRHPLHEVPHGPGRFAGGERVPQLSDNDP